MCSPPSLHLLYPASHCSSARDDALKTIVSFAVCLLFFSWELWVPPLFYQASSSRQRASTVPKVLATRWQSVGGRMALCQTVSFSVSGGSQWPCYGTALPWDFIALYGMQIGVWWDQGQARMQTQNSRFLQRLLASSKSSSHAHWSSYALNFEQIHHVILCSLIIT